jgi:hypothetical protein
MLLYWGDEREGWGGAAVTVIIFSATRRKQVPSGGGVAGVPPMALAYRDDQHIAHFLEIRCYFTSAPLPYHQFAPLLGFD